MSLKAKIEAVIYASEEPVTLVQLAGLLGHEAQAELDHLDSAQQALALENEASNTSESEAEHANALRRHLHDAAVEEAAHFRAERLAVAAATAAMTSGDFLEAGELQPVPEPTIETTSAEEGSEALTPPSEDKDEKKLARETREKERRLREYFRTILDQLIADYASSDRGLEIREVAGGYRFATKPEYHDAVRGFVKSLKPPLKLSLQALETLAVVAYKQPVTAPEITEIRGVDSGGVLGSLMSRKLITTAGRKQVIGRPILYKTTKDFLLRFGLRDINELPSIEEFEKMAGELADQEEIPMPHHAPEGHEELQREKDQSEPQADGDSNDLGETIADEAIVDGRLSGLPPRYDTDQLDSDPDADSPALDAEIQDDMRRESEEG
jgi:segregation and condensation protein B